MASGDLLAEVREAGLIGPGRPLLVLLSGGADSVCLLSVASEVGVELSVLHVNYGLRGEESERDEQHCRELCDQLGVALRVERAALDPSATGNLQAGARDLRYGHAERLAVGDYATGHTRSDEAETILYRLASSPGSRALAGIAPRRGRLVRPLLGHTREQTREYCRARSLAWREDRSNQDPAFARARVRDGLLPTLTEISPG
nr:tRNA lysidine(34) synthetase TilS [Thermoleophilaceae bacterium]